MTHPMKPHEVFGMSATIKREQDYNFPIGSPTPGAAPYAPDTKRDLRIELTEGGVRIEATIGERFPPSDNYQGLVVFLTWDGLRQLVAKFNDKVDEQIRQAAQNIRT